METIKSILSIIKDSGILMGTIMIIGFLSMIFNKKIKKY